MQFTESDIQEFKKIWSAEFNESITNEEAKLSASMLLDLYFLLMVSDAGEVE